MLSAIGLDQITGVFHVAFRVDLKGLTLYSRIRRFEFFAKLGIDSPNTGASVYSAGSTDSNLISLTCGNKQRRGSSNKARAK